MHESFIDARFLGEKGLSEEISQGISGVHQTRCLRTGPHHVQEACPTVNCVWGNPNATYAHLAARECVVRCAKDPARCPYATSKGSSVSLLEAPPGGFAKKANVARRRPANVARRVDGVI